MKNPALKFGDLVNLEGLEKPAEGVLTVVLGGADVKPERVKQLRNEMSGLAEQLENNQDVTIGEVASLVAAMNNALKRELSPKRASKLLAILKKRFLNEITLLNLFNKSRHYNKAAGISWEDVQAKLEASPAKLWSLNEMEKTGGEPDVTDYDPITGEFIFMDCSAESPAHRRDCVYDREAEIKLKKDFSGETCNSNAVSMAALMGVDLLNRKQSRDLHTKGEFDKHTQSWIETPVGTRKTGMARFGYCHGDAEFSPCNHGVNFGWRGSLRV